VAKHKNPTAGLSNGPQCGNPHSPSSTEPARGGSGGSGFVVYDWHNDEDNDTLFGGVGAYYRVEKLSENFSKQYKFIKVNLHDKYAGATRFILRTW
jgi:hypothetical protein